MGNQNKAKLSSIFILYYMSILQQLSRAILFTMPCNLIIWRQVCALGMRVFIAFMYILTEAELLSLLWQKILFPFLWNTYLKTDDTSLIPISYSIGKNFEEKEIGFLKERARDLNYRTNNFRWITEGSFPESCNRIEPPWWTFWKALCNMYQLGLHTKLTWHQIFIQGHNAHVNKHIS